MCSAPMTPRTFSVCRAVFRSALCVGLLLFAVCARSEVIIYQGSARTALDATDQFGKQPRLYLIFDQSNQTLYSNFYFKLNGVKKQFPQFPLSPTHYNPELRSTGNIATFSLAYDSTFNLTNFGAASIYLRGNVKEVLIASNGAGTKAQYPKAMTGIFRLAQRVNTNGTNFEFNLTVTFDPVHTQVANNAFKTGMAAANDISAELTQQGYP